MTAIFTLLSPIAAEMNFPLFIVVRVLEGMGEVSAIIYQDNYQISYFSFFYRV